MTEPSAPDGARLLEPRLHSHVADALPPDHPLATTRVYCDRCDALLHLQSNSCMRTWLETGRGNFCLRCFIVVAGGLAPDDTRLAGVDCLARNFGIGFESVPIRATPANGDAPAANLVRAALEIEVRGRWNALALSKLLVPFHSHLVQHTADRWVVHARAPGYRGEPLAEALEAIAEWRAERGLKASGSLLDSAEATVYIG